jgi:uncharacterized protein (TIGR00725 family)
MTRRPVIAVIGGNEAAAPERELAFAVGVEIAKRGAVLVCGGRGGVMEAAAAGARSIGGHTIGILPGYSPDDANPYIEFAIPTGMAEARNVIVVASANAVIALPGEAGTLSEIALALKLDRPVVALAAWNEINGPRHAESPSSAVNLAFELAAGPEQR